MSYKYYLGWDIGGANTKAVLINNDGKVISLESKFAPLYENLQYLDIAISDITQKMQNDNICHVVTMTGELADVFKSRRDGVKKIISCVKKNISNHALYFSNSDKFFTEDVATNRWTEIASVNWRASSKFVAKHIAEGLCVDIGSTTTDITPIYKNELISSGSNDHERLITKELVYSGVVRTPVMSISRELPFQKDTIGLMAESFAHMSDVYILTGFLKKEESSFMAADKQGKSKLECARRLARMVGKDLCADDNLASWKNFAATIYKTQCRNLSSACSKVRNNASISEKSPIIGCGQGWFLAEMIANDLGCKYIHFDDLLMVEPNPHVAGLVANCAPAYAVAELYRLSL
jgi:probable H4MPT-linked C1 transfer pathway protein